MTRIIPLPGSDLFSKELYETMCQINAGVADLELYEFIYALENLTPALGWASVLPIEKDELNNLVHEKAFYSEIKIKPERNGRIVLDDSILWLTQMLFVGLLTRRYPVEWVNNLFYFDIRGFIFFARTQYFSDAIQTRFGGQPLIQLTPTQHRFAHHQDIGYREFAEANRAVNQAFISAIKQRISVKGTPLLITLVGPTAAGKTEITAQLRTELAQENISATSIEMDNFFKDREFRDGKTLNQEVIHFEIFKRCMAEILGGQSTVMPRYDFIHAISSHGLDGNLRPGQTPLEVEPADIVLLEGNFPFHIPEIAPMIGIKIVYLTDDPIRLKRKWKRDVDYRKKYDPAYLCNRYFRTQFMRAEEVYRPMMEICDIVVDTTSAAVWIASDHTDRQDSGSDSKWNLTQ